MILAIDTSTSLCRALFISADSTDFSEWDAGRELADGLLGFIRKQLLLKDATWQDVTGIIAFKGPGSFTGLRIGLTVINTIADTLSIPVVGMTGEDWIDQGRERLSRGENDAIVLPLYGREPNITRPRK